jgi:hypothetical protein
MYAEAPKPAETLDCVEQVPADVLLEVRLLLLWDDGHQLRV